MRIKINNQWIDILDPYLSANTVRIRVLSFANLAEVRNQYFVRDQSFLKVYFYIKEIGLMPTLIKIASRWRERFRNKKFISIGIGDVIDARSQKMRVGERVFFIAPNHPVYFKRMVVDENCVFSIDLIDLPWLSPEYLMYFTKEHAPRDAWWDPLAGWLPFSGVPCPVGEIQNISKRIVTYFKQADIRHADKIGMSKESPVQETITGSKTHTQALKTAALFGLGNYAKTCILPNLDKRVVVTKIHEIDPLQLLPLNKTIDYDTSPFPREDAHYDVYFIAGYHHTHAQIAIEGLKKNTDVVVEKPLVTTRQDLEELVAIMQHSSARLYACFQKRYHRFNQFVHPDCGLQWGDPISYYAIVYEESLPELHWYRWPNSKSAIVSNGCHWIDHFSFLNNFSKVVRSSAQKLLNGEMVITVGLANGAALSLTLSHLGSPRIGMQEYIELRAKKTTIKIVNSTLYIAENKSRILRKLKENKYNAYRNMYKEISRNIVERNRPNKADSWETVQLVSSLILSLDEEVRQ